jgi:O-antigen ligase
METAVRVVVRVLLVACFWGAFGAGNYFPSLFLSELLGVVVILLFILLSFGRRLRRSTLRYALGPAALILAWIVLYAGVFAERTGAPLSPSILAQRGLVFVLLGPVVLLLSQRGWRLDELERLFVWAGALVVVTYGVANITADLESWRMSDDLSVRGMVAFDEARGFRLKGPHFLCVFIAIYSARAVLLAQGATRRALFLVVTVVAAALLVRNVSRSTLVSAAAGLLLVTLALKSRRRFARMLMLSPLLLSLMVVTVSPMGAMVAGAVDESDWSYLARVDTAAIAWQYFQRYPLLGLGMASYKSISYQDMFGPTFHPSDIGLLGIAFQYGLLGALLYAGFCAWLIRELIKACWAQHESASKRRMLFVTSMSSVCMGIVIATPLQTQFLFDDGLPMAAFTWGWLLTLRHRNAVEGGPGHATMTWAAVGFTGLRRGLLGARGA